ncbi:hypothetical protein IQ267_07200 [filamentous cyanobacterium LEGE 07170]|nr:hypothetical protein [filamentous cyanobacterium LEGE 07170]
MTAVSELKRLRVTVSDPIEPHLAVAGMQQIAGKAIAMVTEVSSHMLPNYTRPKQRNQYA